jgi:hypothetical protein
MKVCKYCKSEINEKATICPNCRKKQPSTNTKILLFIALGLLAFGGIYFSLNDDFKSSSSDSGLFEELFKDNFTITEAKGNVSGMNIATINGKITNNKSEQFRNIVITYKIFNKERQQTGIATTTIQYIDPNETISFIATGPAEYDQNSSFELNSIEAK